MKIFERLRQLNRMSFFNKNLGKSQRYTAFTLAEVLIVLGIIGIIAEMTIPDLIQNTQNAEFISKLKKEYSVLSQAQLMIANDNGGSFLNALSSCTVDAGNTSIGDSCLAGIFEQKIATAQTCDSTNITTNCFPANAKIKYLNGKYIGSTDYWGTTAYATNGFVQNDGSSMIFQLDSASCSSNVQELPNNYCGWITVDLNGLKGPNMWGKDINIFWLGSDRLAPSQHNKDGAITDDCNSSGYGQTCGYKFLMNGK